MPEMHLKQPRFTYSAWNPFTKNKETIKKFEEKGDTSYIYKNELDKACFQLDMAYGDFKDLARRTAFDEVLKDKAFDIAKNPKYDGYQTGLAFMVYKLFDKKSKGSGFNIPLEFNEELAEELHKPIIINFKKRTVYFGSKDSIWGADLAGTQFKSNFNKKGVSIVHVSIINIRFRFIIRVTIRYQIHVFLNHHQ